MAAPPQQAPWPKHTPDALAHGQHAGPPADPRKQPPAESAGVARAGSAAAWKAQASKYEKLAKEKEKEAERLAALYGVIERNEELKQQLKSEIAETDAALTKCAVQLSSAVAGADDAALERALREEEAQLERELAGYAARLRSGLEAFGECATARLPPPAPTHAARALPLASRGPAPPAEARASPPSGPPSPPPPLDESAPLHVCILTGVDEHLDAQGVVDLVRIKTGHVPIRAAFIMRSRERYNPKTNALDPPEFVRSRRFIVAMASHVAAQDVDMKFRGGITADLQSTCKIRSTVLDFVEPRQGDQKARSYREMLSSDVPGVWVPQRTGQDYDAGTSEHGRAAPSIDAPPSSAIVIFKSTELTFTINPEMLLSQLVGLSGLHEHRFLGFGRSKRGLVLEMESLKAARDFHDGLVDKRRKATCNVLDDKEADEMFSNLERRFHPTRPLDAPKRQEKAIQPPKPADTPQPLLPPAPPRCQLPRPAPLAFLEKRDQVPDPSALTMDQASIVLWHQIEYASPSVFACMRQKGYKAAVKSFLNLATGRLGHPRKDPRIRGTYPFQWVWPAYVEAPLDKDPDVVQLYVQVLHGKSSDASSSPFVEPEFAEFVDQVSGKNMGRGASAQTNAGLAGEPSTMNSFIRSEMTPESARSCCAPYGARAAADLLAHAVMVLPNDAGHLEEFARKPIRVLTEKVERHGMHVIVTEVHDFETLPWYYVKTPGRAASPALSPRD